MPKVAAVSLHTTPLDLKGNLTLIKEAILEARKEEASLVVFPELSLSGYGCEDWFLAQHFLDDCVKTLFELVDFCQGITAVVGLPIRWKQATYNCMAVVSNGRLKGIVAKSFLANSGVYYESRWFTPLLDYAWHNFTISIDGKRFNTQIGNGVFVEPATQTVFGIEICEDAWQKEKRPAFQHLQQGATLNLICNASHFEIGKISERLGLIKESAQLGLATLYVNLLGNESGHLIFDGDRHFAWIEEKTGMLVSRPSDRLPFGNKAVSYCDWHHNKPIHQEAIPSAQEEFRLAATRGLYDYGRRSHSSSFVVSLSGGADSSCCAVLIKEMVKRACQELTKEQIAADFRLTIEEDIAKWPLEKQVDYLTKRLLITAWQGTRNSTEATFQSASQIASELKSNHYSWEVDSLVQASIQLIEGQLDRELSWHTDDLALQNIQARVRSPLVWLLANISNGLLITTSNRSEGDVGYATMDGDMSGGLAPIAGVSKCFVKSWLKWAEISLGYSSLAVVNSLQPSAELRPLEANQFDEKDLMSYELLEAIEIGLIYHKKPPRVVFDELAQANPEIPVDHLKAAINKFLRMWTASQWKRERLAPSFHLDKFSISSRYWMRSPVFSRFEPQE